MPQKSESGKKEKRDTRQETGDEKYDEGSVISQKIDYSGSLGEKLYSVPIKCIDISMARIGPNVSIVRSLILRIFAYAPSPSLTAI